MSFEIHIGVGGFGVTLRDEKTSTAVLTDSEARDLVDNLERSPWNDTKQALLEVSLRDRQITAEQGREVIATFRFISGPVDAAKWLVQHRRISDIHNVGALVKDLASWHQREVLGA